MIRKSQELLVLMLSIFGFAFIFLALIFHNYTEQYAIAEAEKLVQDSLLSHRAIHQYVNTISRPELYRLKQEGRLYQRILLSKDDVVYLYCSTNQGVQQ